MTDPSFSCYIAPTEFNTSNPSLDTPEQIQALINHIASLEKEDAELQLEMDALEKRNAELEESIDMLQIERLGIIEKRMEEEKAIAELACEIAHFTREEAIVEREIAALEKICAKKNRQLDFLRHRIAIPLHEEIQEDIALGKAMEKEIPGYERSAAEFELEGTTSILGEEAQKAYEQIQALCPSSVPKKTKAQLFQDLCTCAKMYAMDTRHNTPEGDIMGPIDGEWSHPVCPRYTWRKILLDNGMEGIVERLIEEDQQHE